MLLILITKETMNQMKTNLRMPRMFLHWAEHEARIGWLPAYLRGVFDMARAALWQVEGARMPLEALMRRLKATPGTEIAQALDSLMEPSAGLLVTEGGLVFDPVQVSEWADCVRKAEINRENGKKGGRPTGRPKPPAVAGDPPPQF